MTTLMEWLTKATDPNETKTSYVCPASDGGLIAGDRYRLHYMPPVEGVYPVIIPPAYTLPPNTDNELARAFDNMREAVEWSEEYAINRTDVTMSVNLENTPFAKLPEGYVLWRHWADALSIASNPTWRKNTGYGDVLFITPGVLFHEGIGTTDFVWRVQISPYHIAYLIERSNNGVYSLTPGKSLTVTDPRIMQRLERMAQLRYRHEQISYDVTDPRFEPRYRAGQLADRIEAALSKQQTESAEEAKH